MQLQVHEQPNNEEIANEERRASSHVHQLKKHLEATMRQKAELKWVQLGDENTGFFHQSIKQGHRSNKIIHLHLKGGEISNPCLIQKEFYHFYTNLFCGQLKNKAKIKLDVARNGHILSESLRELLNLTFSKEEIKAAMWSIPDDKAPGLDGFNTKFYNASWDIVGDDVVQAFSLIMGRCPATVTTITLIPKSHCPSHPRDFRPISCCHVLYKCISKLISSKLQLVLGSLIDRVQGAFVSSRSIMHNILLCRVWSSSILGNTVPLVV